MKDFLKLRFVRLLKAGKYSIQGFRFLLKEKPVQDELVVCTILVPVALCVDDITVAERILLIGSLFGVLLSEFFNTAVEAVIDRIGLEENMYSGMAKDIGSAAVLFSIIWTAIVWVWILFQ